jgi:hypothetical protein
MKIYWPLKRLRYFNVIVKLDSGFVSRGTIALLDQDSSFAIYQSSARGVKQATTSRANKLTQATLAVLELGISRQLISPCAGYE